MSAVRKSFSNVFYPSIHLDWKDKRPTMGYPRGIPKEHTNKIKKERLVG
jgi:hypothetical protein